MAQILDVVQHILCQVTDSRARLVVEFKARLCSHTSLGKFFSGERDTWSPLLGRFNLQIR
jgi:hypothetical protein